MMQACCGVISMLINALPSQFSRERAARSADPYSGALTESEVRDVTFWVCKGYEQGLLHIDHLATYFLALLLGYRHSQIINLKVQDLTYSEELKSWRLKVEMIKQKNKSAPVYVFVRLPVLVNTFHDYLVPLCNARGKDYLIHRTASYSGCHVPEELIRELPNKKCIGSVLLGRVQEVIYSLGVRAPRV